MSDDAEKGGVGAAVVVRRAVEPTRCFAEVVSSLGYDVVEGIETDREEHGRYNVGPGTVERISEVVGREAVEVVAFDNLLHPGQTADVTVELPDDVEVLDRRATVYRRLSEAGGEAAAVALRRWRLRVRRRLLLNRSLSGDSGDRVEDRVSDIERRMDDASESLKETRRRAEDRIRSTEAYGDAGDGGDGGRLSVAVVGDACAPTSEAVGRIADDEASVGADGLPLSPAETETYSGSVGPHPVYVTDCPGFVRVRREANVEGDGDGDGEGEPSYPVGPPDWYSDVVPAALAVLREGDVVALVGYEDVDGLGGWLRGFEADVVEVDVGRGPDGGVTEEAVESALLSAEPLSTKALTVRMSYGDEAHSVVSRIHDEFLVEDVTYEDRISIEVVAPEARIEGLRAMVSEAEGEVSKSDDGSC